jgi:hypothetical protein
MFWVFTTLILGLIFVLSNTQNQLTMQLTINDYDLAFSASGGWAKVEIFGKEIRFDFLQADAINAAIELGIINQPDDRDDDRIGYEKQLFSATARESFDYAKRIQYQFNFEALREFSGTDFAEQIVSRLALQSNEVREVIQDEAERIALHECPAVTVDYKEIMEWFAHNRHEVFLCGVVNWDKISYHKKELWYAAEEETLNQL